MRSQDPNDVPQIGGEGVGLQTLQSFLREGEAEITRMYSETCKRSTDDHLFPIRGKQFYLEVTRMHASYVIVSGKAQETRVKKMRAVLGISAMPGQEKQMNVKEGVRHVKALSSSTSCHESQVSLGTQRSVNAFAYNKPCRAVAQRSRHEALVPAVEDPVSSIGNLECADDIVGQTATALHESIPSLNYNQEGDNVSGSLQKATECMKASGDAALCSRKLASKQILMRPVIRGRLKTLEDYVHVWLRGAYRGVTIRKLRCSDQRRNANPPITNNEWGTEKHVVKRLFEAVNIVAHYLPGHEPSASIPEELWEVAVNEAYKNLAKDKGRRASMTLIRSEAKSKGIEFKCKDPGTLKVR